jgi:hypothetical protein
MTKAVHQIPESLDPESLEDDELVIAADQIFLDLDRHEGLVRLLGDSNERLDP